jgi:TonB-linked SusC/RagA family outer membrane protein
MNRRKSLIIMKTTAFLIFLGVVRAFGASTYSQEPRLSLNLKNASLTQAFDEIERQSEYIFFYKDRDIDKTSRVTLNLNDLPVRTILDTLFSGVPLDYQIINRQIVIIPEPAKPSAAVQPALKPAFKVNGTVRDAKTNTPIPTVNILEKGTRNGVASDVNGRFEIEVSNPNAILQFSYVGYTSRDVPVNSRPVLDITLQETTEALGEVVVMGYTEKTANEISSAVQVIKSEDLLDVTAPNIGTMLQGKVSGVEVVNSGGSPGAAAEIRIRGTGSISAGSDPLYVVDGIIGGDFSPNDVESITILKDAGATGLYGSRAAGGVIIVTTKKGSAGEMRVNLKTTTGAKQISNGNFQLMNSEELYAFQRTLFTPAALPLIRPAKLKETDFDWIGEAFHPGMVQDYYLSVSGKSNKIAYYFSADVYDEDGTLLETDFRRISFRNNLKYDITNRITLSTNLNVSKSTNTGYQYNSLYDAYLYLPWDVPYDAGGNPRYVDATSQNWYSRDKRNFIHSDSYNYDGGKGLAINGDVSLNIQITDWLAFSSSNRLAMGTGWYRSLIDPRVKEGIAMGGSLYNSNDLSTYGITSNMLKFKKDFGDHHLNGLVGVETEKNDYELLAATGQGIPVSLSILDAASVPLSVSGTRSESAFTSAFSQVSYNFKGRYFATASYRLDGSSKFGINNRWGSFPSASASWLLSEEDFMKKISSVDLLKLRASYGVTGNANIGDFQHLAKYAFTTQYASNPAGYPQNLPNPDLGWEKAHTLNLGVDVNFSKRIGITLDVYDIKNKDLLLNVPLSPSSGFEYQTRNSGTVQNRGIELMLRTVNIRKAGFEWETSFNIAVNRNKVLWLSDGITEIITGVEAKQIIQVGKDIYTWYMPKWLGVDPANGDPLWEKIIYDEAGTEVSRESTNNYNEAQFQEVGTATPKFTGGLISNMSYKGFSLNVALNYVYGNQIYHRSRQFFDNDGAYIAYNSMKLMDGWSRWENAGDVATHPKAVANGNKLANNVSSRYIENGSYLRMRNISLSYQVPETFSRKLNLSSVRIFVSGDNLFTWTNFSGMDPEVSINGDSWTRPGTGDFKYPISQQVLFGVDVTF